MTSLALAACIFWLAVLDARFTARHGNWGELNRFVRRFGPWVGVMLPTAALVVGLLWLKADVLLGIILGIRLQLAFNQGIVAKLERRLSRSSIQDLWDAGPSSSASPVLPGEQFPSSRSEN